MDRRPAPQNARTPWRTGAGRTGPVLLVAFVAAWPMMILTLSYDWFGARSWLLPEAPTTPTSVPRSIATGPGDQVSAAPVEFRSTPGRPDPESDAGIPTDPPRDASQDAYRQLVANCEYWTGQVRAGAAMASTQNLACDRMRQYAATHGLKSPSVPNYRPARARPRSVTTTASAQSGRAGKALAERCLEVDEAIAEVRAEQRAGYGVAEGERLKERLRILHKAQRGDCRNVRR